MSKRSQGKKPTGYLVKGKPGIRGDSSGDLYVYGTVAELRKIMAVYEEWSLQDMPEYKLWTAALVRLEGQREAA